MYLIRQFLLIGDISQTAPFALSLSKGCPQGAPLLRQAQPERLRKICLGHVPIESASLNLKYPFGLSLSKPRAALRQAQRERCKQIRAVSIVRCCTLEGTLKTDGFLVRARRKPQRYQQVSRGFATQPWPKRRGFQCLIACDTALIESASLNLKYPFGLSLSKPCAALRQAQRERFK